MDELIIAVQTGPLAARVEARLDPALEAEAEAVARFLGAMRDVARGNSSATTSGVASAEGRLVSFTFGPGHVPYGVEAVREWLRASGWSRRAHAPGRRVHACVAPRRAAGILA